MAQFQEVWGDPPAAVLFVLTQASIACIEVSEVLLSGQMLNVKHDQNIEHCVDQTVTFQNCFI